MLLIVDTITSIFQATVFGISIFYCVDDRQKLYKSILSGIALFFIGTFFTRILGNLSICVFITHILSLILLMIIFRKQRVEAIIGYTMIYALLSILAILCNNAFYGISYKIKDIEVLQIFKIICIYVMQILLGGFIILKRTHIRDVYKFITNEKKNAPILMIISFILDWMIAVNLIVYKDETGIHKNISFTIICIIFIIFVSYFARVKQNSDEMFKLNRVLEGKNKELSKIKHDYGAQISYLYGLYLMKRFDELGDSLKNIINNNNSVESAVEINENNNVLLSLATQNALDQGIHVIINDKCSLKEIDMDEMEIYRIIKNIVNNAVKAMNGEGIIKLDIYEYLNNIVIKISNNGPKIPEELLSKIFEAGYTTKDNLDGGHGFGLSIVKELIDAHDGNISVKSTDSETEFKIVFSNRNKKKN